MARLMRHLGAGLALGVLTGAVARGFMALLTEDPEFTWAGTGFILGVFGMAGLALAAAYDVKLRRRSRRWKLVTLPALMVFFGPGMLLAPGVLGLALVRARSRWLRALGLLAFVGFLAIILVEGTGSEEPVTLRTVTGFVIMTGCCGVLAAAARAALTGWSADTSTEPSAQVGRGQRVEGGLGDVGLRAAG